MSKDWDYARWPNFERSEFACKCGCGFDDIAPETVDVFQWARNRYGVPVTVTSGCRCPEHNRAVGGAENSRHPKGEAGDMKVRGVPAIVVYTDLDAEFCGRLGLGLYQEQDFVHVDSRFGYARWEG